VRNTHTHGAVQAPLACAFALSYSPKESPTGEKAKNRNDKPPKEKNLVEQPAASGGVRENEESLVYCFAKDLADRDRCLRPPPPWHPSSALFRGHQPVMLLLMLCCLRIACSPPLFPLGGWICSSSTDLCFDRWKKRWRNEKVWEKGKGSRGGGLLHKLTNASVQ